MAEAQTPNKTDGPPDPAAGEVTPHVDAGPDAPLPSTRPDGAAPGAGDVLPQWGGRYTIRGRLGHGGMGTVYLATDTLLGREVALKVPQRPGGGTPGAWRERFYREARIAAGFRHPDLCPVYDLGEHGGTFFLTMPIIPGEPLSERLRRAGRLAPAEAVRLVARLADAMQFAHTAGVLHRDLKPANVMLRPPQDDPIVMDFGLAVGGPGSTSRLTTAGSFLGTPAYSPPEQLAGEWSEVGPASDVYSLGVILYQALTGKLPFRGDWHALAHRAGSESFTPPSREAPDVPPSLDAVCHRALAWRPADRFPSMSEFAAALRADAPAVPVPPVPAPRPGRRWGRLAWPAAVLGLTTLAWLALTRPRPVTEAGASQKPSVAVSLLAPAQPQAEPNPARPEASPGDPFVVGSVWSGTFEFRPKADGIPVNLAGALSLRVTSRDAGRFRGVYRSENRYEWVVEGTVEGGHVRWGYTEAIRDAPHKSVVGHCECQADFRGGELDGTFVNKLMKMTADFRLRRRD